MGVPYFPCGGRHAVWEHFPSCLRMTMTTLLYTTQLSTSLLVYSKQQCRPAVHLYVQASRAPLCPGQPCTSMHIFIFVVFTSTPYLSSLSRRAVFVYRTDGPCTAPHRVQHHTVHQHHTVYSTTPCTAPHRVQCAQVAAAYLCIPPTFTPDPDPPPDHHGSPAPRPCCCFSPCPCPSPHPLDHRPFPCPHPPCPHLQSLPGREMPPAPGPLFLAPPSPPLRAPPSPPAGVAATPCASPSPCAPFAPGTRTAHAQHTQHTRSTQW